LTSPAEPSGVVADWVYIRASGEAGRVLERRRVWGEVVCQVWVPATGTVLRVREEDLEALEAGRDAGGPHRLTYLTAAARIADALQRDTLIAPLESPLIPLPHQIHALSRALSGDGVRYLLADEVGLGKTIEAGLIMKELKIRGLVRRTLVAAPAGLVFQWVQEMRTHFDEDFRILTPGNFGSVRQMTGLGQEANIWQLHDQVVCSVDSVKPVEGRRGWTRDQTARHNRERFEDLVSAGWDLVIIDEAHRLGGSSEQVSRYQLGEGLAQASPYLLLLSATPHSGKTDSFRRLLSFLDSDAFPDDSAIRQDRVAPYVIRTEKRHAIATEGKPLFKPREVRLLPVEWGGDQAEHKALYEAVTEYVRDGYNQALREKQTAVGFLMILMQRLVSSSTRAIRTALERRLEVLELPEGQLSLFGEDITWDWAALETDDQLETVLKARLKGLRNERSEVELLLSAARRCEAGGPDAKARELLELVQRLEREENDPELKVLIFSEFLPTQAMLEEFLGERGYSVVTLNGSMDMDQRQMAQREFAEHARILVSTEAGGEGINLQFCHVVVNYDLPWNPMRIEQRIGRVDRIGQSHVVRAFNLALEDTVELRVRQVLEEKLQRILEEFGVDKLGDVLDSEDVDVDFEQLYVRAMLDPSHADANTDRFAEELRQRAAAAREGLKVLGESGPLDSEDARRIEDHQLPFWTERMTISFLRSRAADGAQATRRDRGYDLVWLDGERFENAVFLRDEAATGVSEHLSLENPRIRELFKQLPLFVPGAPIGSTEVHGVSDKVSGTWSLWRIALETADGSEQRVLPVFIADDGRVLAPTARLIWDRLIEKDPSPTVYVPAAVTGPESVELFERSRAVAEEQGASVYRELRDAHAARTERERLKLEQAHEARRNAIQRIGLAQVRDYRLRQLERELVESRARIATREQAVPDLGAIILVRVAEPEGRQ
jgi:superfamily II DNA or RNA helicase